ncbi:TonB C-terminal domain-containing protein [Undibacterium sp. Jales W-56]|nr:TonB C-terminal domain-containing protein [Undibacterium sp. Jales W-56]MCU6434721.1 TonB C-terminal domain-containing protein [Undibacterium sp. Jales W-56]
MISLVVHGMVLLMHFVAPRPAEAVAADPGLEVILVNAKHDKKPLKAEALAQADLDGGGASDAGRAKSPLPDMRKTENGDSIMTAKRKVEELEERQKNLMDQVNLKTPFNSSKASDSNKTDDSKQSSNGRDNADSNQALARMAAEISQTIEDQNKRPRKTFITPSTQAVGYAIYYKTLQKKIEDIGTLNFPQKDGKKLYGELIIYIPIFQDGTIYEKDGGPRVEKSSGNRSLDAAALRIVRRAAPFGKFPVNMRSNDKDDLWVVITRFKFTRDQQLETELRGGPN